VATVHRIIDESENWTKSDKPEEGVYYELANESPTLARYVFTELFFIESSVAN